MFKDLKEWSFGFRWFIILIISLIVIAIGVICYFLIANGEGKYILLFLGITAMTGMISAVIEWLN